MWVQNRSLLVPLRAWHPQERDRPLRILGVVLSMALVQTIVVALGTTVSGSVVKALKRLLAKKEGHPLDP